MWNERCLISASVKISMGDMAVPLVPRVMLPKVGTPLCPISDFTPDAVHIAAFVCVGALAILDRLDEVDYQTLSWWLAERQLANGGLNGRPEKKEDVSLRSILEIPNPWMVDRYATAFGFSQRYLSSTSSTGSILRSLPSSSFQLRSVLLV